MKWINHAEQLQSLCQSWVQQPIIALDTEFERSTTFYPELALLQVADSSHAHTQYLIDALAIQQLPDYFSEVLQSPVIKVFHAGQEDIEIFSYWPSSKKITAVFDTQIAAAYVGLGPQVSYQSLVKKLLDIDLDKTQTRTNWLQRPLTEDQLLYAAHDVKYLLPCYELLCKQLQQQDRLAWVLEDCQQLIPAKEHIPLPEEYYLTLSSAWFFNGQQLSVLKALCAWREKYIRQHNLPRSFVAKDGMLLAIAEKIPRSPMALREYLDYKSRHLNIEEIMLDIIQQAVKAAQQGDIPSALIQPIAQPVVLQKKYKPVLQKIKSAAAEIAQQLNLPDVLVLRQKWLERLVSAFLSGGDAIHSQLPVALQGWRYEKVVRPLQYIFEQESD